jgi:predicted phage tail protein
MQEENGIESGNGGVAHMTANGNMNLVVYGFQRVTSAITISHRVVTRSMPNMSIP